MFFQWTVDSVRVHSSALSSATTASWRRSAPAAWAKFTSPPTSTSPATCQSIRPPGRVVNESARKHLRKEALILSQLNHPNIATIYDFDTQQSVDFLVMEYISGVTLEDKLSGGALPEKEVLRLGVQLADGLCAAHEQGVVHRDLKPSNLRVTKDGWLKILDFGLALLRMPATSDATTIESLSDGDPGAGTLRYMAPEQLLGEKIDARADVHAAGLVLFEMVTGQHPFADAERAQLIGAILRRPPCWPGTLKVRPSSELERIVGKCLEKDPENRYQSAKELAVDLRRLLTPSTTKIVAARGADKKLWKMLISGMLIIGAAALAGAWYFRTQQTPPPLTDKDTIVLADFDNKTSDAIFDDTLKTALTVSLRQSPFLDVLSENRVIDILKLMNLPISTKLTPEVVRELCQRTNSKAYIAGSIVTLGSEYVIALKAVNCQTGDTLDQEQITAKSKEQVLNALGTAASRLRSQLGESTDTARKFDVPLQQATTSSLEALQAYSLGRKITMENANIQTALIYDHRATELDPNFAMAYSALGADYNWLGQMERAKGYY